jgi:hypothetical protein
VRLAISSRGYWVLPGIYRVLAKIRMRVRVSDPPQSGIQVRYGYRPGSNVAVPGTYPDPLCTLLDSKGLSFYLTAASGFRLPSVF